MDAASGGALRAKSYDEAYELIEMMAANEYQNPTQRLSHGKVEGILEVDTATAIAAQLKALTMKVDSLTNYGVQQVASVCELCAGAHDTNQCAISSESVQFVSNFQRSQQPAPATYHPNNRNHPNFSWSNNQGAQQPQQPYQQARPFNQGYQQQYAPRQPYQPPGFHQQPQANAGQPSNEKSEMDELRLMIKSLAVSQKTLENQMGQLASAMLSRQQGTLPSDTEVNPGRRDGKEQVKAVTLRLGKVTSDPKSVTKEDEKVQNRQVEKSAVPEIQKSDLVADQLDGELDKSKEPVEKASPEQSLKNNQIYPPPPYPRRLQKQNLDKKFAKFLEVFKKLQINIPFAEALEQMSSYAKFIEDDLWVSLCKLCQYVCALKMFH